MEQRRDGRCAVGGRITIVIIFAKEQELFDAKSSGDLLFWITPELTTYLPDKEI